jgi:hypothetical protein
MRRLWDDIAPAAVAGLALFVVAFGLTHLLSHAGLPVPLVLAAAGLAGAPTYLLVIRLLFRTVWSDLGTLARRVVLARKRVPDPEAERVPSLARAPAGAG